MALPKVAIVGRPNVGKSSILNWLAGRRISIVDPTAGVTRDRVGALVQLGEDETDARFFELIDTGGIGIVDRDDLTSHVEEQIQTGIAEAAFILFVVDVRDGRLPLDEEVARRVRMTQLPVVLVINKADTPDFELRADEFGRLGFGEPVFVSSAQNRNKNLLLRRIAEKLPAIDDFKPVDATMKIAVVGRPNTGKSTFINTLAQAERMIVSEVAGTTRDSVDVRFELDGLPFVAIDTAGVRRKAKIRDSLDFYSIHRAERSIRRADVVLLFLDPTQGISKLDKQLTDYVAKQYKPCIFVVNKWDLIAFDKTSNVTSSEAMGKFAQVVQEVFRSMSYMPLAFITAKTGRNVKALLNLAQTMYNQSSGRVSTGMLNRVVRDAVEAHPPAFREGKNPRIYYGTQVSSSPPTIVLFVNKPSLFDPTYQRYLLNTFRDKLPFHDIPIKMYLRARTQTDPNSPSKPEDPTADLGLRTGDVLSDPSWSEGGLPDLHALNQEVNELLSNVDFNE